MVWPLPRSLAATSGITVLFSFPEGTKMFQFPSFALLKICILFRVVLADRVPPFGYHRVKAFLAARRCFSQPNTSFFASRYLGILRTPLIASYKASFTLLVCVSISFLSCLLLFSCQITFGLFVSLLFAEGLYKTFYSKELKCPLIHSVRGYPKTCAFMVDARRVELLTPRMQIWCSPN